MRDVFDARGYGEVATPALEYEAVLTRGDQAAADPAYRLFDEHGNVLVLRSDMTIPIARVVATRYPTAPSAAALLLHRARLPRRPPAPRAAARDPAGGDRARRRARARGHGGGGLRAVRDAGRRRAGLLPRRASATRRCSRARWSAPACRTRRGRRSCTSSPRATWSGSSASCAAVGARRAARHRARRAAASRSCPEAEPLRELYALLAPDVAERVIFDLGLVRTLGYYTGAVFEVYDAAFGSPLGGGGRYDDLLGRFGRSLPACGWALDVERVHAARLEEGAMRIAVPARGAVHARRSTCSTGSGSTPPRCAPTTASCSSRRPG